MLDAFAVFTRGGALLWSLQFTVMRHSPIEALNALIRSCLLEERSGEDTFTYAPKAGSQQALKWTFHNGLGLVFVAMYQKALSLMYVDELLAAVRTEFAAQYKPNVLSYPGFKEPFSKLLRQCEARAEDLKRVGTVKAAQQSARAIMHQSGKQPANGKTSSSVTGAVVVAAGGGANGVKAASEGDEEGQDDDADAAAASEDSASAAEVSSSTDAGVAFNVSKLTKGSKTGPGGRGLRAAPAKPSLPVVKKPQEVAKKKARNWGSLKSSAADMTKLDYSVDASEATGGSESERQGYSDADTAGGRGAPVVAGVSHMDVEEVVEELVLDESELQAPAKPGAAPAAKGLLGSFISSLAIRVVGKQALSAEDLAPALVEMKRKLMERNVAEEIAQNICDSVGRSLEGQRLASFTGVGAVVAREFEAALAGILNKRTVDMLLDIKKAQERGKPYVVVFCGVNGVGKSTNLAKIAYWLGQHGVKVLIAACDTFRAGAVEQLKTHCARLQVPLYERGYEKDPAKVALEAVKQAEREGRHVVLVDTAGRMQDNEPLMRALSNLININSPNLVLFVGEALVGNDAVDQLTKFNRALHDLAPATATKRHVIDGIVLTKFDTIDDKVGAAVSMVYASSAPIMFLGCGQTYADLKRLNVKAVVNALLK